MQSIKIFVFLTFFIYFAYAAEDGKLSFCYRDADGCGPGTTLWDPLCHTGKRQTPIELPVNLRSSGLTHLRLLGSYRGLFFRLQNSGHSINVDFVGESGKNEGPSALIFSFPDPLDMKIRRDYRFASAHFHWGLTDSVGSEHCIGTKCFSMEAHFVHISTKYRTMAEAQASGDENALAVLGLFIDSDKKIARPSALTTLIARSSISPIVRHLEQVKHASHDGRSLSVHEPLDFTQLIVTENPAQVYSYKGSLTTPGCNQQVNWFVLKKPAIIPHGDLEAFRTILLDGNGKVLDENHRPLQALNGRRIYLHNAIPVL